MGTAVSQFGAGANLRGNSFRRGLRSADAEVALELVATPYADSPASPVDIDGVVPRERSEASARALNVVVALFA